MATSDEHGASTVGEPRFGERTDVEDADVALAVEIVTRRRGFSRNDPAGKAPESRRVAARIKVDPIDQRRVDDRGTQSDVIEITERERRR